MVTPEFVIKFEELIRETKVFGTFSGMFRGIKQVKKAIFRKKKKKKLKQNYFGVFRLILFLVIFSQICLIFFFTFSIPPTKMN